MKGLSGIFVSSSEVRLEQTSKVKTGNSGTGGLNLRPQQVVDASVVDILSPRRVRLKINGENVVANTHVPLKSGDQVQLKVISNEQPPVLKLMTENRESGFQELAGHLKSFGRSGAYDPLLKLLSEMESKHLTGDLLPKADKAPDFRSLLQHLKALVADMALQSDQPDPTLLKKWVTHSGLQELRDSEQSGPRPFLNGSPMPVRESDLKAIVLQTLQSVKIEDESLTTSLRSFAEHLEHLQQFNQKTFDESGKMLLPVPLLWNNELKFGQFLLDMGKDRSQKPASERIIKVSMLLEMSHLGDVRADFAVFKKSISGFFGVGSKAIQQFFLSRIPAVIESLKEQQFAVQKIDCQVLRPETLANATLMDDMLLSEDGMLHVLV
jgi:hypothetical protein